MNNEETLAEILTLEKTMDRKALGSRFAGKTDEELADIQQMYEDDIKTKKPRMKSLA